MKAFQKIIFTILLLQSTALLADQESLCLQAMDLAKNVCGEERTNQKFQAPEYTMIKASAHTRNRFTMSINIDEQRANIEAAKEEIRSQCQGILGEFRVYDGGAEGYNTLVMAPCFARPMTRQERINATFNERTLSESTATIGI